MSAVSVMSFYMFHWEKIIEKNPGDLLPKMVVSWDGYHEFDGNLMVIYPLVNIQKAIENGP